MEVSLLSKYKHENLVSLIGFCGESGEKILVYKYEANQSLDKYLRNTKDLNWMRRLQICLGAARGLRYLHDETGSGHGVIHRDIKSSNILLDEKWKAKISDFGLSKIALTNSADSIVFTSPCGTRGYVDPQILYGGITQKSDVYSFGVVLYEVLFGKLVAIPEYVGDGRFTVKMAKRHYEEKTLHTMIDPDLKSEMNSDSLSTFASIAYQCLKKQTKDRPTMSLVVKELEKALGYQEESSTRENLRLSSSSRVFLYDVYISYTDKDFSRNFLNKYLVDALESEGFSYYIYNRYFRGSCDEPSSNISAIKQSRSFIILFSRSFASDCSNLDDVAAIMECVKETRSVVMPVFYLDLYDPDTREHRKEYFRQRMSGYESSSSSSQKKIQVWSNALVEASNFPGIEDRWFSGGRDISDEVIAIIKHQLQQKDSY